MREKTGYYDRHGKAIRDGDKIKEEVFTGYVEKHHDEWFLCNKKLLVSLDLLTDIEILED